MRLGLKGLSFKKPTAQQLQDCADQGSREGPNHPLVGASRHYQAPETKTWLTEYVDGWIVDYDAIKVGKGREAYLSARDAVKSWKHMCLGWVDTNRPPVKRGSSVCIMAKMLCFWQRNPLEIVYVTEEESSSESIIDQKAPVIKKGLNAFFLTNMKPDMCQRFAFGQTTLHGHALAGEERFGVSWKADDSVWYEIYAFSRAKTVLAVAAYPLRRFFQQKFRRHSARTVATIVQAQCRNGATTNM